MINLTNLSVNEVNIILNCLSKAPYEMVHELVVKVKTQAESQVNKPEEPKNP